MKATTQRLFHYVLTHQFASIATAQVDSSDRMAMNLIYWLADHHLVIHPLVREPEIKQYLLKECKGFFEKQQWKHDPDAVLFLLLVTLGNKPFDHFTQYRFHRYKVYFSNAFTDLYLTQPKMLDLIDCIQDNKQAFPFLDLLKGIWYFTLKEYSKAKNHLKNVIDADRKKVALYFQACIDLALGQYDELRQKLATLETTVVPFSIEVFLKDAKEAIHQHHHLDFFTDIKAIYDVDKIQLYIEKVFDLSLWRKADQKTKTMVKTAFYLSSRMSRLIDNDTIQDYSSFALPFVKAYEHECYKLFFKDFIQYLIKEGVSPRQSIPPHSRKGRYISIVDMDQEPYQYRAPEPENFSIGSIPFILDISHKLASKESKQVDPTGLSIAPLFERYWIKRTSFLPLSSQGKGKLINLAEQAFLISKLRNKMTHAETLTLIEFKEIVSLILENRQLQELMLINVSS
jgi:hypothetical protein